MRESRTLRALSATILVLAGLAAAIPASAQLVCRDVTITGGAGDAIEIVVCEGTPGGGEPGEGPQIGDCFYRVAIADDFEQPVLGIPGTLGISSGSVIPNNDDGTIDIRAYSATGVWYKRFCINGDGEAVPITDDGGDGPGDLIPGGPATTIPQLIDRALATLDPPDPPLVTAPDVAKAGQITVQTPMWWWLPDDYWVLYDSSSANGRLNVTVFGDPADSEFITGDPLGPEMVPCEGQGTEWVLGMDIDAPDCGFTYRTSSAVNGGTFSTNLLVNFDLSYDTNGPSGPGVIDLPFFRDSDVELPVGEIQALN